MKTTIDIADSLLLEAKKAASRKGTTVRALVEDGLRRVLESRGPKRKFQLRKAAVGGRGLQKGVRDGDWRQIRGLIYEGRGS